VCVRVCVCMGLGRQKRRNEVIASFMSVWSRRSEAQSVTNLLPCSTDLDKFLVPFFYPGMLSARDSCMTV